MPNSDEQQIQQELATIAHRIDTILQKIAAVEPAPGQGQDPSGAPPDDKTGAVDPTVDEGHKSIS